MSRPRLECIVSALGNVGLISWRGPDATPEFCQTSVAKVVTRLNGWDVAVSYQTDETPEYGVTHATLTLTLDGVPVVAKGLAEAALSDALAPEEV